MKNMEDRIVHIPIKKIIRGRFQTRSFETEDEIEKLARSIEEVGLIHPIVVRIYPGIPDRYEVVSGHRRVEAVKLLGWDTIPAFIRSLDDREMAEMGVVENLQRKELNPIEEARSYEALSKLGYSIKEIANKVGKSRPHIANTLRLLELHPFLRECVLCKTLSRWQAHIIGQAPTGISTVILADLAMDWGLTVEALRKIVKGLKEGDRFISWIRDVPVDALIDFPCDSTISWSGEPVKEALEPILVQMPGIIMDARVNREILDSLGCETIRAEVFYMREWLMDSHAAYARDSKSVRSPGSYPVDPGIIPWPTEAQRRAMKLLVDRLRRHEEDYPVHITPLFL